MESIGIIAEYNPFHNGHLYQIKKIKEKYPDSYLILVMSGNFTERGTPSLIDKWKKTEIALKAGLDLVIELPFPFLYNIIKLNCLFNIIIFFLSISIANI